MGKKSMTGKLSDIWLKASVVGSLWASVEIIIGSFFHNLRMPMAGTILAMISVVIMVSFHRLWKEKGLFWRAGLICALMKSISPSAILLGPMTGIFAEALLMEASTRVLGGNLTGYLIGGALALSSTIAHKIINLLIIYGMDFMTVLVNMYQFAVKQIGMPDLQPGLALWVLFGWYAFLGMMASVMGFVLGKKAVNRKPAGEAVAAFKSIGPNQFFSIAADQRFSVKLLFFHLFAIAVCLVMINTLNFYTGHVFIGAYTGFCVVYYKRALRHLKKPFFWVQVVVLTLLATLFYNGFRHGNIFDTEGLMVGIRMNVRAVLILVGFSAISVELRNPMVKTVLWKRGFSQLYLSLGLAFSALPAVIDTFAKPRQLLRRPARHIAGIIAQADELLQQFKVQNLKPSVLLIVGEKHQGKTTFALALAQELKSTGKPTAGFCAPGEFENNRRSAFSILDLQSETQRPLCSIHRSTGDSVGPFRFDPEGQNFGQQLLDPGNLPEAAYVFIDEVGPLEMSGGGWAPAIDRLMDQPGLRLIMVVRSGLVQQVTEKWNLSNVMIFDIDKISAKEVAQRI